MIPFVFSASQIVPPIVSEMEFFAQAITTAVSLLTQKTLKIAKGPPLVATEEQTYFAIGAKLKCVGSTAWNV